MFIGRSDSVRDNRRMKSNRVPILSVLSAALALVLASPVALADNDQDRARAAVQAGKALPLKAVLERLEREHPGQVLEVELEQDDGRWIYEIKLLQAGGRLLKLELDAASGEVLRRKERLRQPDSRP
jgi:uncharacterized membrane protein YkoI